jgi:Rad3-related DNA helicase
LAAAGLPGPGDFAGRIEAVAILAVEAAVRLEAVETERPIGEVEAELAAARAELARLSRPDWDEAPLLPLAPDAPEPDTATLIEERARLAAEADRAERTLPDVERLADRLDALRRRVAILENAAGTGPNLMSFEEAEMALLGRLAQARRVGRHSEPLPLLVDDALAAFGRHDKGRLLDLLARLSDASQIIYLTDDPDTIKWAEARAGEGRVAVLAPDAVPSPA